VCSRSTLVGLHESEDVVSAEDDARAGPESHGVADERAVDVADCVTARRHRHRLYSRVTAS